MTTAGDKMVNLKERWRRFRAWQENLNCCCGNCYVSCMDGGHQAITFSPDTRHPGLNVLSMLHEAGLLE